LKKKSIKNNAERKQDKEVTTTNTQNKEATENDKATWRAYFLVSTA